MKEGTVTQQRIGGNSDVKKHTGRAMNCSG
jgi:hypothetical protein